MTTVYLCEKPSQARDIGKIVGTKNQHEHYLEGDDIKVTWCYGHLLAAMPPEAYNEQFKTWRIADLPIVPVQWRLEPVAKAKKQLKAVQQILNQADRVIIATDADREGELIAREVLDYCKFRGRIERLWLSALDDASIKKALLQIKPGSHTESLYLAGLGRQRADWLVGMNLTRAATCTLGSGKRETLSVGRVQTPTLKLVVDRDRAIEAFKPKDYYILLAQFQNEQNQSFWSKWEAPKSILDEQGYCLNRNLISTFSEKIVGQVGVVQDFQENELQKAPPLCLSLSNLQKLASAQHGFSAKKTLELAQSLYETHKAISYPRTDCNYLPESQHAEVPFIINTLKTIDIKLESVISQCDPSLKSLVWNDKKLTAHHAIIPTLNTKVNIDKLSKDEYEIYDLIRLYYLAQFSGNYIYLNRKVTVLCQGETFKAASNQPIKLGWKSLLQRTDEAEKDDDHLSTIPKLHKDQPVKNTDQRLEAKKTQPPAYFTEGTLIESMKNIAKLVTEPALRKVLKETAGIGTEATRAAILDNLVNREYLMRKGKQLRSTDKAKTLIDALPTLVKEPALTARWEQALDDVASGQLKLESFMAQQIEHLNILLQAVCSNTPNESHQNDSTLNDPICPECGKVMVKRKSSHGYFFGCSAYPQCKKTVPIESLSKQSKKDSSHKECPKCRQGILHLKQGKRGSFWGCSRFPECKATVDAKNI